MTHTVNGKVDKFSAVFSLVGGNISECEGVFTFHDNQTPPTENEIITELNKLQKTYDDNITKQATDKASANAKLKDLGLTDDEIKAIKS